jgi:hypothetical protein
MPCPRGFALGLVAGCLALAVPVARGQDAITAPDGPGMPGAESGVPGQTSILMIVIAPAVQQELKLDDDQKNRIFALAREGQKKGRDLMQAALRGGGQGNPQAFLAAGAQLRQENERAVSKILKPDQKERVDQILLQVDGPLAVSRPEIGKKIGLSQSQTQKVQLTMMQMMQAQRQMFLAARFGGGGGNGGDVMPEAGQLAAGRAAMNKLREDATRQLARILTAKQREAFNTLLGEPFDLAKIDPALARRSAARSSDDASDDDAPKPKTKRKGATPKKKAAAKEKEKDAEDGSTAKP